VFFGREFVRYNDQNIPLFISDADKLKGKSEPKTIEGMLTYL